MEERAAVGFVKLIVSTVVIIFTLITSWILGLRMRQRIRQTLGVNVDSEAELTSLKTWMNVESIEEQNHGGKLK
jgi:hypothetical protein